MNVRFCGADKLIDDIRKRVIGFFVYKVCDVLRFSFDSIILSAFLGLTVLAKYNNYYYLKIQHLKAMDLKQRILNQAQIALDSKNAFQLFLPEPIAVVNNGFK